MFESRQKRSVYQFLSKSNHLNEFNMKFTIFALLLLVGLAVYAEEDGAEEGVEEEAEGGVKGEAEEGAEEGADEDGDGGTAGTAES